MFSPSIRLYWRHEPIRPSQPPHLHVVPVSPGLAGSVSGGGLEDFPAPETDLRGSGEDQGAGKARGSLGDIRGKADVGACDCDGQGRRLPEVNARTIRQVEASVKSAHHQARDRKKFCLYRVVRRKRPAQSAGQIMNGLLGYNDITVSAIFSCP